VGEPRRADAPSLPKASSPGTSANDEDYGNPTTLRFSRRLGEAWADAEYASAFEGSNQKFSVRYAGTFGLSVILATLAAFAIGVMGMG
jgi:hypothetical protein